MVTTHVFLDGGRDGRLIEDARRMGREKAGPNRTNSAPEVFGKLVKDEDQTITRWTYSPLLGAWATDRKDDDRTKTDGQGGVFWNRTFPVGDKVIEVIPFDFEARFGKAPQQARWREGWRRTSIRGALPRNKTPHAGRSDLSSHTSTKGAVSREESLTC